MAFGDICGQIILLQTRTSNILADWTKETVTLEDKKVKHFELFAIYHSIKIPGKSLASSAKALITNETATLLWHFLQAGK